MWLECQIAGLHRCQLRYAQRPSEAQMEHGPITNSGPVGGYWSIQDGLQLLRREVFDQTTVCLLYRKRENSPNLIQRRRDPILHEVHERLYRGKPSISGARSIAARRFQIAQEVDNQT